MNSKFLFSALTLLFCLCSFGQLVNIESKRMQTDSIRFVLKSDLLFSYNNNDGDYIFQLGGSLSTQIKSKDLKKIYFLISNYNLIRSENEDFQNGWFVHLRFNYKLSNLFRIEAFVQSQHNELLDVNLRNLIGAGLRLKVLSKDHLKLYWGNAYMYEAEKSDIVGKRSYDHRHSTYLSATILALEDKISLINTIYYQPRYSDFSDYRISEQFKAEIPISESLNVFCLFNYYFDSLTPLNKKDFSSNISIGIGYSL